MLRRLREGFARKLLENNGPMFGVEIEVDMAALPEYADALLAFLANPPRGAPAQVKRVTPSPQSVRQLMITSQAHASWVVGLHHARPEHGVGSLRIKAGKASNDMLMVACTETSPMIITHRAPKGATAARPLEGRYTL